MLQRNLLYTGVTRGKRLVVLVGQKKAVAIAVRNASGRRRWSKLAEWLSPCCTRLTVNWRGEPSHGGCGLFTGSAGAGLARRGRAGLDATDIRKSPGTATFGMRVARRIAARAVFNQHALDALAGNVGQLVLVEQGHLGVLRLRRLREDAAERQGGDKQRTENAFQRTPILRMADAR